MLILCTIGSVLSLAIAVWVYVDYRSRRARASVRTHGDVLATAKAQASEMIARAREEAAQLRVVTEDEIHTTQALADATERHASNWDREIRERRLANDTRRRELNAKRDTLLEEISNLDEQRSGISDQLAEISGLPKEEATTIVIQQIASELESEHVDCVSRAVQAKIADGIGTAKTLIGDAIQRQDVSHIDDTPRIAPIPLEGLNERTKERLLSALEAVATKTDSDMSVNADRNLVSIRNNNPIEREVAREVGVEILERRLSAQEVPPLLVRTHSALHKQIVTLGERTMWDMELEGRPELAELLGTLNYRFSYGQNALLHCKETGHLCMMLAAELRLDPASARSAGVLHDIGKAVDHNVEGSHAIIGGELLAILGTDAAIVHAVKAHHFDEEPESDLAMLTICADAISASRPGARRDTLTTYLARLEQLQQIATRHTGVERAFPMQAGREVRISVKPSVVRDADVSILCNEIAREIEAEMNYPGMIKVTVVRETVATATA